MMIPEIDATDHRFNNISKKTEHNKGRWFEPAAFVFEGNQAQRRLSNKCLISAMALPGFKCLGQVLVQFMMV